MISNQEWSLNRVSLNGSSTMIWKSFCCRRFVLKSMTMCSSMLIFSRDIYLGQSSPAKVQEIYYFSFSLICHLRLWSCLMAYGLTGKRSLDCSSCIRYNFSCWSSYIEVYNECLCFFQSWPDLRFISYVLWLHGALGRAYSVSYREMGQKWTIFLWVRIKLSINIFLILTLPS